MSGGSFSSPALISRKESRQRPSSQERRLPSGRRKVTRRAAKMTRRAAKERSGAATLATRASRCTTALCRVPATPLAKSAHLRKARQECAELEIKQPQVMASEGHSALFLFYSAAMMPTHISMKLRGGGCVASKPSSTENRGQGVPPLAQAQLQDVSVDVVALAESPVSEELLDLITQSPAQNVASDYTAVAQPLASPGLAESPPTADQPSAAASTDHRDASRSILMHM